MAYAKQKKPFESEDTKMETITFEQAMSLNILPDDIRQAAFKARKPRGVGIFRCLQLSFIKGQHVLDDEIIEVEFRDKISGGNPVGWTPPKGEGFDDKWARVDLFTLEVVELRMSDAERRKKAQNELHEAVIKCNDEESANMPLRHIASVVFQNVLKATAENGHFAIEGVHGGFSAFKLIRTTQKDNEDEEAYVLCNIHNGDMYRVAIESDFDIAYATLGDDDFEQLEQLQEMKERNIKYRNERIKKEIWAKYGLSYETLP